MGILRQFCRPNNSLRTTSNLGFVSSHRSIDLSRLTASWLLSDGAPPPDLRLFFAEVLRKLSLDFSTIKLGHGLCSFHRADAVGPCTCEDDVHLFQTSTLRLWEQEVDCRNKGSVENRKDDVCPPWRTKSVITLQLMRLSYVHWRLAKAGGVIMTITKFDNQLKIVLTAFAWIRVRRLVNSAGSSHVIPSQLNERCKSAGRLQRHIK